MKWNAWTRQVHRWMSVAFTGLFVVVSVAAVTQEEPTEWVFYLPLTLLLLTGLNLFVLPYSARWRARRGDG